MLICIGQRSSQIGHEIAKISLVDDLKKEKEILYIDDSHVPSQHLYSKKVGKNFVRVNIPAQNWNDGYLATETHDLFLGMRRLLEKRGDNVHKQTVILYDAGCGLGTGQVSRILSRMSIDCPGMGKSAVGIMAPCSNAFDAMNNLLSLPYIIEYSDTLMLRGYLDMLSLIGSKSASTNLPLSSNLQPVHACIAADVYAAFFALDSSIFPLWYSSVVSPSNKFVDVRSSLWRSVLRQSFQTGHTRGTSGGKPLEVESVVQNSNRLLANNIHALYLTQSEDIRNTKYHVRFTHNISFSRAKPSVAAAAAAAAGSSSKPPQSILHMSVTNAAASIPDLSPMLRWAAPSVSWSASPAPAPMVPHTPTVVGAARSTESSGAGGETAVMAFASPFVLEEVRRTARLARAALGAKAFLHNFLARGLELEDFTTALEMVQSYLDDVMA